MFGGWNGLEALKDVRWGGSWLDCFDFYRLEGGERPFL
jgi:hypothetical protein